MEPTKTGYRTALIIRKLFKKGDSIKQVKEHYNEPDNKKLNEFITTIGLTTGLKE